MTKPANQPPRISSFKKKGPVTVIDLDGKTVRVVEASPGGSNAKIHKVLLGQLDFGDRIPTDPSGLGAALKNALSALKVRPKNALFSVPRHHVVLRPLIVPNVLDVRELASIINFQIAKDLPFRLEEAIVDFKVLRLLAPEPSSEPEKSNAPTTEPKDSCPANAERLEVLVGAIKKDVLEHYRALALAAGIKLAGLALTSSGNLRALEALGELDHTPALLLVSVRNEETTVEIIAHQTIALTRVAAGTATENTEPGQPSEKFFTNLATEVLRSLHSYEGMMWQEPVTKIFIAGNSGMESRVADVLGARLGLPVGFLPSFEKLELKTNADSGALTAIGLALATLDPGGLPIDFAAPKKPAVPTNKNRTRAVIALAAAFVLLLSLFALRAHLVKKRNAIKTAVQEQLTDAERKLPIYKKLKIQTKLVKGWTDEEQNWLDHLAWLSGILPGADQLYISSLATTSQKVIRMSVQARTGELLAELDKKLRAAGYEVKPLSITPANDKYGYNFRTTVELAVPKKLKVDLQKVNPPKRPDDDVFKTSSHARPAGGSIAAR